MNSGNLNLTLTPQTSLGDDDNMSNYRKYYQFVKPYRVIIVITLLIGMVKFAIPLVIPLILKHVVDLLLSDLPAKDKIHSLTLIIGASLILFVIIRSPVEYYRQYFAQAAVSRILFDIRNKLYEHIQKLSVRYYQNHKVGEVISRFINDVEQTKNLVEVGLMNVWLDLFSLVLVLSIMFFYLDPSLTLVSIIVIPFYAVAVKILYKRLRALTKDRSQALADIQAYLHERIQGIPVIRSFTLERQESIWFGRRNYNFLTKALSHTQWNALTFSVVNTLTDIAPIIVIGYGAYQVINGSMIMSEFVAFVAYLPTLYGPLRRLVNSSTTLTQASASLERVVEFMVEPYDIIDHPGALNLQNSEGHIEFNNVWFKYNDHNDWILKNVSLTVEPGKTVALVGASGGGKSSLVSLLPRFFDIHQGTICLDGHDIKGLTLQSLRKQVGMVLQDNILFSGSVRENIMMGNPDSNEQLMIEAAVAANAHEFIIQLPNGYDTEIGERGVKLSGGQKQRIAIARVFLKNPKILVLDEATSALDLESEHLIQQSLELLAQNRTTLIVAHRLSTITHADQIIVIEGGEIKERGTHMQLMEAEGIYHRLFTVQKITLIE
jgi:ABC-type multidrug transport system fused ATPase/permease subunit